MDHHMKTGSSKNWGMKQWLITAVAVVVVLCAVWFTVGQDWVDGMAAGQTEDRTRELFYGGSAKSVMDLFITSASAEQAPAPTTTAVESFAVEDEGAGIDALTESEPAANDDAPVAVQPEGDFKDLFVQNPDTIGWLKAGENIDGPVVQRDNEYYLKHNFFGEEDKNGTLFVNMNNQLVPRDDVLLIHGHDMKSGAMFGKLLKFREESYMKQHPLVVFRTINDTKNVYYVPIAGFDASMLPGKQSYFDITQISFEDDSTETVNPNVSTKRHSKAFQTYLDSLQEWSYWKSPVDVNVDDELLMLITCSYIQEDGRFMLVCRKLRDNETPEMIETMMK